MPGVHCVEMCVFLTSMDIAKDMARESLRKARAHGNVLVFSDLNCYPSIKNPPSLAYSFSLRTPAICTKSGLCLFLKVSGGSIAISSKVPCFSTLLQWPFFDNTPIYKFSVLPSGPSKCICTCCAKISSCRRSWFRQNLVNLVLAMNDKTQCLHHPVKNGFPLIFEKSP